MRKQNKKPQGPACEQPPVDTPSYEAAETAVGLAKNLGQQSWEEHLRASGRRTTEYAEATSARAGCRRR